MRTQGTVADTNLAWMTGALWAKRGERDISRVARDEGKRKIIFQKPNHKYTSSC